MPRHDELSGIQEGLELSKVFIQKEAEQALWTQGIATDPYPSQVEILNSHQKVLGYFGANRCLAIETAVQMAGGYLKLLRDMEIGDEVMAFDFKTGDFCPSKVEFVYHNGFKNIWRFKWVCGEEDWHIDCTRSHKVCVQYPKTGRFAMVRINRAVHDQLPVVVRKRSGAPGLAYLEWGGFVERAETMDLRIAHENHAFAGNGTVISNSGKTHSAMVKCAWDVTGIYPDWYRGPKTARGIDCWVMGDTNENTRDTAQRKLFGPDVERPGWTDKPFKEGLIASKYIIGKPSRKSAPSGSFDSVRVKHVPSDTTSLLTFKSHKMDRQALASWHGARVYMDEEPDLDILMEMIARVADDRGQIFVSMCPLDGMTPTVKWIIDNAERNPDLVKLCYLPHTEAKHLAPEEKEAMLRMYASNPAMLIARTEGRVVPNHGLIFPFPAQDIMYDPAKTSISSRWPCLGGADVGWRHPWGACVGARDPLSDVIYVYATYEQAERPYMYHHAQLNQWGENLTFMIDPASYQSGQATGERILENLWKLAHGENWEDIPEENRKYLKAERVFEVGMDAMWNRFSGGRLKFNRNLRTLLEQYESYAWDKDGRGPKTETPELKYDVITSVRYMTHGHVQYGHTLDRAPWRDMGEFESPIEVPEWRKFRAGEDHR